MPTAQALSTLATNQPRSSRQAEPVRRRQSSVRRTYLVPLDRLSLEHRPDGSTQEVTSVRFGPNEILLLDRDELTRRVPVDALARFGAKYQFPTGELDGFRWLATSRTEPGGPLERRTWLGQLNTALVELDPVELFRSTYDTGQIPDCSKRFVAIEVRTSKLI